MKAATILLLFAWVAVIGSIGLLLAFPPEVIAQSIVTPLDGEPFTISGKDELVRVAGTGIAGSRIEAKVTGPAEVSASHVIRWVARGKFQRGLTLKEFDIKPTGTGKVSVTVTVTPPQKDAVKKVATYQFTVK
jgi:hypothetical protein